METKGSRLRGCALSGETQFLTKKKYPLIKIKKKIMKATLWDSGALPNEVTKEKRGAGLWGRRLQPGASASCRELPSQCFRANGGLESTPLDG